MNDNYHYSFVDESGITSPFSGSRFFFLDLLDTLATRHQKYLQIVSL
jgi:hypothetical protein